MTVFYLSWTTASDASSLSVATLRRLVRRGVLSRPLRLGPGRVGFPSDVFEAELRAYVKALNAPASASPKATAARV